MTAPLICPSILASDFARLGEEGVDLFLTDSTNAEVPGFIASEKAIGPVLADVVARAKQRVIVASFASHVHRIQQIAEVDVGHVAQGHEVREADRVGRRPTTEGQRRMTARLALAALFGAPWRPLRSPPRLAC